MATTDVPGANPRNKDRLDVGCWAEDDKGTSLIHIIGHEDGQVIFQVYDLDNEEFFQDSMVESEFKATFSLPPTGKSAERWTWHDKVSVPWDRIMKRLKRPSPQKTDIRSGLETAARKVATALGLKGKKLSAEDVAPNVSEERKKAGYEVMDKVAEAIGRFVERA